MTKTRFNVGRSDFNVGFELRERLELRRELGFFTARLQTRRVSTSMFERCRRHHSQIRNLAKLTVDATTIVVAS